MSFSVWFLPLTAVGLARAVLFDLGVHEKGTFPTKSHRKGTTWLSAEIQHHANFTNEG